MKLNVKNSTEVQRIGEISPKDHIKNDKGGRLYWVDYLAKLPFIHPADIDKEKIEKLEYYTPQGGYRSIYKEGDIVVVTINGVQMRQVEPSTHPNTDSYENE